MIEILNRCNYLYNNLTDCIDKDINEKKNNDCLTCTQNNFRGMDNDSYNCLKKLCTYTMFYGPLYVDEIYNFLVQENFLTNFISQIRNNIKQDCTNEFSVFTEDYKVPVSLNIMSLGCGFGPDDIALNKYRDTYLDWNVNFNYYGYDKEPLWNFITQSNALPITADLLMGMNFQYVHILFINKLFSTLRNLRLGGNFLTVLGNALQNLPLGSFVIFNDINNENEGREEFNDFAIKNNLQAISKYYIGKYTGNYTPLQMNCNVTNLINNPAISPKNFLNQTVFFLYKKV
ncbi:hypothetical protein ACOL24_02310 [Aliarcobacter butzleri]|uniref:hypothetical protein n=1 Tax=Aliarcobacter butzleri TaxID=28197 RepID=UPI003AFA9B16